MSDEHEKPKGRLDLEYDAMCQHGLDRGLEPHELLTVAAVVCGRGVAVHILNGLPPEDGEVMLRQLQWTMREAAGLNQADGPSEH